LNDGLNAHGILSIPRTQYDVFNGSCAVCVEGGRNPDVVFGVALHGALAVCILPEYTADSALVGESKGFLLLGAKQAQPVVSGFAFHGGYDAWKIDGLVPGRSE